jgi:hypothetical protein
MTYEKRNVILVKCGWDSYALPLNDMNLSLVRCMIEDAQAIDYDYIKNDGYVYYPKSKNKISFEIKSVQWAASKPEVAPEDE